MDASIASDPLVTAVAGRGLVDPSSPVLAADDAGLTRGDGCFEGCRLRRTPHGSTIEHLDRHLDRFAASAAALDLPFDRSAWEDLCALVAGAWLEESDDPEAAVRLVLTRGRPAAGPTALATVNPVPTSTYAARRDGIDVVTLDRGLTADAFAGRPWLLGGVKSLSYAVNMAAQREAQRRSADDVVFTSSDGQLLEAPTATVVWVTEGTVSTVADGTNGILHSITTEVLLEQAAGAGFKVASRPATVDDLLVADLVLLVSSIRGPVRVNHLDGAPLSTGAELLTLIQELTGTNC